MHSTFNDKQQCEMQCTWRLTEWTFGCILWSVFPGKYELTLKHRRILRKKSKDGNMTGNVRTKVLRTDVDRLGTPNPVWANFQFQELPHTFVPFIRRDAALVLGYGRKGLESGYPLCKSRTAWRFIFFWFFIFVCTILMLFEQKPNSYMQGRSCVHNQGGRRAGI